MPYLLPFTGRYVLFSTHSGVGQYWHYSSTMLLDSENIGGYVVTAVLVICYISYMRELVYLTCLSQLIRRN